MKKNHLIHRLALVPLLFMFHVADADSPDTTPPAASDLAQQGQDKLQHATSRQDYEDAANLLKQAAKANPNDYDVRMTLGWVYLDKLHEPETAYVYLNTVVKHSPNDVNARKLLGQACMQTGRNGKAVEQFRAAARLQPGDPWIQANLGRSLARVGDYGGANKIFDDVLKTDPNNVDARLGKAEVAAWEGHSAVALEDLNALKTENPTNAEVLTLMGDIHRWNCDLTEAKQDYQAALEADPNDAAATDGLMQAKSMGAPVISGNAYYFQDTSHFLREFAGGDARVPLTDKAYLTAGGADWRFSSPGFNNIYRVDGRAGVEYDWNKWLQTSVEGDVFKYYNNNQDIFGGGEASVKISPTKDFDIYTVVAGNQPFVSSIATVANGLKQDSVGNGINIKLFGPISFQNDFQAAYLSDNNSWFEEKPQLSWKVLNVPETFLRVQYDFLSYTRTNATYWTPHNRNVVWPVLDVNLPICKGVKIVVDARAPYVFEQEQWGYQVQAGPEIDIGRHVSLKAYYYQSSIPGDEGAWSGKGGQATLTVRF
jgi:tetratricopeptide (TPR) repeat protein